MKSSATQKVLYPFLALVFAFFAWVQRNDIDPAVYHQPSSMDATLWFLFYGLIAVLFVVALFKRIPVWVLIASALFCIVEMVLTGPGLVENLFGKESFTMTQTQMSAEDPRVELTREFFGALIALAGVVLLYFGERKKSLGASVGS